MFHPRIIDTIQEGYKFAFFKRDILSGLTVAIVAIPLSIAFAIASGATPIVGIFTAIIGGLVVSLFGGSKYNISGPAGAFIGIIYSIIANYGYSGLLISTFIGGMFLIIASIIKLGKLVKKIPNCIIIGFSLGLGIDILSGQLFDFCGIINYDGGSFLKKIFSFIININSINIKSILLGFFSIFIILVVRKINQSLPAFLISIVIATIILKLTNLQVETINGRFGIMQLSFPDLHKEVLFEIEHFSNLFVYLSSGITIGILAGVEALLAATIADKMTNSYHRPNTELFALGISNCISSLFGCLPIAGTTARTIVNVKSGAKSPISGVFHGIFLIVLISIFGKSISDVAMSTIAGVLFVVAIDMMSWKKIINLIKSKNKIEIFMLFLTAIFVLVFGIVVAIILNTILYYILKRFLKKFLNS